MRGFARSDNKKGAGELKSGYCRNTRSANVHLRGCATRAARARFQALKPHTHTMPTPIGTVPTNLTNFRHAGAHRTTWKTGNFACHLTRLGVPEFKANTRAQSSIPDDVLCVLGAGGGLADLNAGAGEGSGSAGGLIAIVQQSGDLAVSMRLFDAVSGGVK